MLAADPLHAPHDPEIQTTLADAPGQLPDAHESRPVRRFDGRKYARKGFDAGWPKLAALAIFVLLWQAVIWWGYKPRIIKPPREVFSTAVDLWREGVIPDSIATTMLPRPCMRWLEMFPPGFVEKMDVDMPNVAEVGLRSYTV